MGVWAPLLARPSLNKAQERGFDRSVVTLHNISFSLKLIYVDRTITQDSRCSVHKLFIFMKFFQMGLQYEHRYKSDFIFYIIMMLQYFLSLLSQSSDGGFGR